ncbi:hypothetical protein [Planctobacterium marinum]
MKLLKYNLAFLLWIVANSILGAILASSLPSSVEADRLLLLAKNAMDEGNNVAAIEAFEKVKKLNVPVFDNFHFYYAKALQAELRSQKALRELSIFLTKVDSNNHNYKAALDLYNKAEEAEKRRIDNIKAEQEREKRQKEERQRLQKQKEKEERDKENVFLSKLEALKPNMIEIPSGKFTFYSFKSKARNTTFLSLFAEEVSEAEQAYLNEIAVLNEEGQKTLRFKPKGWREDLNEVIAAHIETALNKVENIEDYKSFIYHRIASGWITGCINATEIDSDILKYVHENGDKVYRKFTQYSVKEGCPSQERASQVRAYAAENWFEKGSNNLLKVHFLESFKLQDRKVSWQLYNLCVEYGTCELTPKISNTLETQQKNNTKFSLDFPAIVPLSNIVQQFIPWLNSVTDEPYRLPSLQEINFVGRDGFLREHSLTISTNKHGVYGLYNGPSEYVHNCPSPHNNPFNTECGERPFANFSADPVLRTHHKQYLNSTSSAGFRLAIDIRD